MIFWELDSRLPGINTSVGSEWEFWYLTASNNLHHLD